MFYWEFESSTLSHASTQNIWKFWSNVDSWNKWDAEVQWAKLDGPFTKGAKGTLKPNGWPVCKFLVTHVELDHKFHDVTKMPLTSMEFQHEMVVKDNLTKITHRVVVKGLLAPLLYFTLRPKLKMGLARAVKSLAELAENLGK